jgi:hypothetical protein
MNYSELPLKQRIEMASDYALLLIEESIANDDIVLELQERFVLTEDQAFEALARTKEVHGEEYRKLTNASLFRASGALMVSIVCGTFYIFMGNEVGFIFILIGAIFLILGYSAMGVIVEKIMGKFFYAPSLVKKRIRENGKGKNKDKDPHDWTVHVFVFSLCFFILSFFLYFKKEGFVQIDKLFTMHGLELKDSLQYVRTSGKSPSYYYVFRFKNYPNEFRFYDDYYDYASERMDVRLFFPSDTLSIQIKPSDYLGKIYERVDGRIDIINLFKESRQWIDLTYRNQRKLSANKKLVEASLFVSFFCLVVMIVRHKLAADKDRQNGVV